MADQVIGHLQDMAAYVLKTYMDAPQAPHPEVLNEVLRQPIFQGNHAEKPETCILDDQFRALVVGGHVRPQPDASTAPLLHMLHCMRVRSHTAHGAASSQLQSCSSDAQVHLCHASAGLALDQ